MNLNANDAVFTLNRLLYFVIDVLPPGCLCADKNDRYARVLQSVIDQPFDGRVSIPSCVFPQGRIMEASRRRSDNVWDISDLIHAPDVPLVVEAKKHSTRHASLHF
jgi:hypothetical protein